MIKLMEGIPLDSKKTNLMYMYYYRVFFTMKMYLKQEYSSLLVQWKGHKEDFNIDNEMSRHSLKNRWITLKNNDWLNLC